VKDLISGERPSGDGARFVICDHSLSIITMAGPMWAFRRKRSAASSAYLRDRLSRIHVVVGGAS
jgi:hypothetical protein